MTAAGTPLTTWRSRLARPRRRAPGKRRAQREPQAQRERQAQRLEAWPASAGWLAHLPFALVLAGVAAGVGTIGLGTRYIHSGTLVISGVLLIAAVARLVLPDRRAGLLSSRRRSLDVAIYAALGLGLLAVGLLAPATS